MDNAMPVPAWYLRTVDAQEDANVEVVFRRVKSQVTSSNASETRSYGVPCLTNTCALKMADEVAVFRGERKVTEKRALCVLGSASSREGPTKVSRT